MHGYGDLLEKIEAAIDRLPSIAQREQLSKRISEREIYVGEIHVSLHNIRTENASEVAVRVFNGTDGTLSLIRVEGTILWQISAPSQKTLPKQLPPISIRSDTSRSVGPKSEWFFIFEQRIPSSDAVMIADAIDACAENENAVQFDFREFKILVAPDDLPDNVVRVPLWGGATFGKGIRSGRIIYAEMNIRANIGVSQG